MNFKFQKGFTLIELLIVIALIGFLVGFLIINLIGVRQRARDGERKADLKTIQSALELYRADQGSYPAPLPNCNTPLYGPGATPTTYLKSTPCDPIGSPPPRYGYLAPPGLNPQTYLLIACLENVNDKEKDAADGAPGDLCAASGVVSYSVTNP